MVSHLPYRVTDHVLPPLENRKEVGKPLDLGEPKMRLRTIQQHLADRGDCRYGLRGLKCHLANDETLYRILDSRWGESCLMVRIIPAVNWDAYLAADDAECLRVGG